MGRIDIRKVNALHKRFFRDNAYTRRAEKTAYIVCRTSVATSMHLHQWLNKPAHGRYWRYLVAMSI